jgi:predicted HAD superfamily Cof-like phosphohydrolase
MLFLNSINFELNRYNNMNKQIDHVRKFHEVYEAPIGKNPSMPSKERMTLRHRLLSEELQEYKDACQNDDLVEVADSLVDLAYILFGTVLEHGLQDQFVEMFEEVQRSNMSKLGRDGQPIKREDGKILKGPDFFLPDLKGILKANSVH